ncbi:MAG: type I DNA topoisomerase [Ruminococcaceae bacterium]|nr:type I DNA topoisomerase [Oscillospiraceae bacterium]
MSKLVILESPSKAKTVKGYLGAGYEVLASTGHVRDLPKSKIGIDIENNFEPKYMNLAAKKDVIKKLKDAAAKSDFVYLATDPDREGEAIAWHLAHILELDTTQSNRVVFNEITKSGVNVGMSNPRSVDMSLVDAQQARRVLDRLVGYKLSPFLWKKVKRGLSAGRVQSVVLRLIVDREKEIKSFVPEEYWTIDATLIKDRKKFTVSLYGTADGKKMSVANETEANAILSAVENGVFKVEAVKHGTKQMQPAPPFNTSTMQQEAARKLGYDGKRTMRIAQALYEGVDVPGKGTTGLITYMRTDSLRISEEARAAANEFIKSHYGENYLPSKPRYFKAKKGAQDAHEAIRPTSMDLTPEMVKPAVTLEQYKLYKLVWERFMASLMAAQVRDTVSADIVNGNYLFKASGYKVKFDGYAALYVEGKDIDDEKNCNVPALTVGEELKVDSAKGIKSEQHFTQPPARYNYATLTKTLEENGIGRPSTYAPIVSNVEQREYITKINKAFAPTPLGETVTELMCDYFKRIVDVKFTAGMEEKLDQIAEGNRNWTDTIREFYDDFDKTLKSAEKDMDGKHLKVPDEETEEVCELCGRKMVIKSGRFGKFLACPGYPQCKNTKPIVHDLPGTCPQCGSKLVQRNTKKGKKFYGCGGYPNCKFMTWDEPTKELCPECGKTLFKNRGKVKCLAEGCTYEKTATRKSKKETANED